MIFLDLFSGQGDSGKDEVKMIYTGYYEKVHKYREAGLRLVSISQSNPRWAGRMEVEVRFMPSWEIISGCKNGRITEAEYIEFFRRENLQGLDPKIGEQYQDAILLCYETPDKFCHRHLVAEWLRENGFECEEWKAKC